METKEFKIIIDDIAVKSGFEKLYGAWFKESDECIVALILVRSNYGKQYYLRIKVNLRNAFGRTYIKDKEWVKHDIAHVMLGFDRMHNDCLDLDKPINDLLRRQKLEELFMSGIIPITDKALSRKGLIESSEKGEINLLPAIKKELGLT